MFPPFGGRLLARESPGVVLAPLACIHPGLPRGKGCALFFVYLLARTATPNAPVYSMYVAPRSLCSLGIMSPLPPRSVSAGPWRPKSAPARSGRALPTLPPRTRSPRRKVLFKDNVRFPSPCNSAPFAPECLRRSGLPGRGYGLAS